jgi:hypothetical protein
VGDGSSVIFDRGLRIRRAMTAGLAIAAALSTFCVVVGIYLIARSGLGQDQASESSSRTTSPSSHQTFQLPQAGVVLLPLLLTFILTAILDSVNAIPSVTLRWSLLREKRLRFNTSRRPFTSSKSHGPNAWYVNAISASALILAYGSNALVAYPIFEGMNTTNDSGTVARKSSPGLSFSGWAILILGLSLAVQTATAFWALLASKCVRSWNSHPIITAKAFTQNRESRDSVCELLDWPNKERLASDASTDTITTLKAVSKPKDRQSPLRDIRPSVRRVAIIMRCLFGFTALCVVFVVVFTIHRSSTNSHFVMSNSGASSAFAYWRYFGLVDVNSSLLSQREWLGVVVQTVLQLCITLGLHCVELPVNLWHDESLWRQASTPAGVRLSNHSFSLLSDSRCLTLFAFKTTIHWVFANAVSAQTTISIRLLPLLTLFLLTALLVLFVEYLTRAQPKGPQPATYGNIHAMTHLIDDWGVDTMWWGDKGSAQVDGIRKAGTAGYKLPPVLMDELYVGIRT